MLRFFRFVVILLVWELWGMVEYCVSMNVNGLDRWVKVCVVGIIVLLLMCVGWMGMR